MWQGTGSTNKWNLSCYNPRVQAVLFGFRWFVRGGGRSTAVAVTIGTVADESRKKMADGVVTSPSRLCSRDGKICCYGDALSTIFLLACFCVLVPTFRYSFFFSYFFPSIPACFIFFVSLRHCCSKKSATLSKYVFFSTCSSCLCRLYPTPSWNYFVVLFV